MLVDQEEGESIRDQIGAGSNSKATEGKGDTKPKDGLGPSTLGQVSLPVVLVNVTLDTHLCNCPVCDPGYHARVEAEASEKAEAAYEQKITKDEKANLLLKRRSMSWWKLQARVKLFSVFYRSLASII